MVRSKRVCKFCGRKTNSAGKPFGSYFAFMGHQGRCAKNPKRILPPKNYGSHDGLEHVATLLEANGREMLQMAQKIRTIVGAGYGPQVTL